MKKKLTIQLLTIAIAIIAFSATEAAAQKRLKFDKNGNAKVSSNVKANKSVTYSISGKDFRKLDIKQTKGGILDTRSDVGANFYPAGTQAAILFD